MHQQGPLSKELNDLLYASLFASYPEEFESTKQVMEALLSGKQNQNKYYKDLEATRTDAKGKPTPAPEGMLKSPNVIQVQFVPDEELDN